MKNISEVTSMKLWNYVLHTDIIPSVHERWVLVEMFMEICTADQHFKIRQEFKIVVMNKLGDITRKLRKAVEWGQE